MRLNSFLKDLPELAKSCELHGVLSITQNQQTHRQCFGYADWDFDIKNNSETLFNLASLNKMFTATMLVILKIDFAEKAIHYLPKNWRDPQLKDITIEQLLTHQSGLGDYFPLLTQYPREKFQQLQDYKKIWPASPLIYKPGTQQQYSNWGFLLLGLIIEEKLHRPYRQCLHELITRPLRMEYTDCPPMDSVIKNLAKGYFEDNGVIRHNLFAHVYQGGSAGGGISNIGDLEKFSAIFTNFLNPDQKEILFKRQGPFAKGLQVEGNWIGHTGIFYGIRNYYYYHQKNQTLFILLANHGKKLKKIWQHFQAAITD